MEYKIYYTEICHLVKRSWHRVSCAS